MPITAPRIPKVDNTRLYSVTAIWKDKDNKSIYRQEFIIAATNEKDALNIGHNHIPSKLTNSIDPHPADNVKLTVRDYGMPLPNRTYYSSPILPNSYKPVMPGPMEQTPIAENSEKVSEDEKIKPIVKHIQLTQAQEPTEQDSEKPDENTDASTNSSDTSDATSTSDTSDTENNHSETNDESTNSTEQEESTPKEPKQNILLSDYICASDFAMYWGTEIGKLNVKPLSTMEKEIIMKLAQVYMPQRLFLDWAKEYNQIKEEQNIKPIQFFKKKMAAFIDSNITHKQEEKSETTENNDEKEIENNETT